MNMVLIQTWLSKFQNPLYKNSIFIILTSIANAGFGFIFWILSARIYVKEDIGIATALISSMSLLILLSRFGLDDSIVRFYPEGNKDKIFSTSMLITSLFVFLLGIIFIFGIDIWSPELQIIKQYAPFYLLFLVAYSIVSLSGISFIALRKAQYYFFQTVITSLRLILIIPLISFGVLGIFGSVGICYILALLFSFFVLYNFKFRFGGIDQTFLTKSFHFSAGNYLSSLLLAIPNLILPILVLNVLGPLATADYYIAFSIASILFIIPSAFSLSLYVEGSHGESIKTNSIKSLVGIFTLLIPAVILLYFFGDKILGFVGRDYTAGFELLKLLAISSFFIAISNLYLSIKRVQKKTRTIVFISTVIFLLTIGISYLLLNKLGITGIGYAWIISYGFCCLIIGISMLSIRSSN